MPKKKKYELKIVEENELEDVVIARFVSYVLGINLEVEEDCVERKCDEPETPEESSDEEE